MFIAPQSDKEGFLYTYGKRKGRKPYVLGIGCSNSNPEYIPREFPNNMIRIITNFQDGQKNSHQEYQRDGKSELEMEFRMKRYSMLPLTILQRIQKTFTFSL